MPTPAERDARYRKRRRTGRFTIALSEGDSWFDYPMYPNLIDLVDEEARLAVRRLEISGDTVINMVGEYPTWQGLDALIEVASHEAPEIILFSGGGNDIVGTGDIEGMFGAYVEGAPLEYYLETERWKRKIEYLRDAYDVLATQLGPIAPVFAHGYDFIVPAWKPVRYDGINIRVGPWVSPDRERSGIRGAWLQRSIGQLMIDRFNAMLQDVATEAAPFFVHIDLRGTLDPDTDWQNEIHPTEGGFQKIATELARQLRAKMPQVLAARAAIGLGRDV